MVYHIDYVVFISMPSYCATQKLKFCYSKINAFENTLTIGFKDF